MWFSFKVKLQSSETNLFQLSVPTVFKCVVGHIRDDAKYINIISLHFNMQYLRYQYILISIFLEYRYLWYYFSLISWRLLPCYPSLQFQAYSPLKHDSLRSSCRLFSLDNYHKFHTRHFCKYRICIVILIVPNEEYSLPK